VVSDAQRERIMGILAQYSTSPELEIQQRSVEYDSLFGQREIVVGVLEQMPAPEIKATVIGTVSENRVVGSTNHQDQDLIGSDEPVSVDTNGGQIAKNVVDSIFGLDLVNPTAPHQTRQSAVNDILDLFNHSASPAVSPAAPSSYASPTLLQSSSPFGFTPSVVPAQQTVVPVPVPAPAPVPAATPANSYTAYEKSFLKITLTPQVSPARPGVVNILARFQVSGAQSISNVNFQAAVPKTQQLQMLPMSNTTISPGAVETQQMRVLAPQGSQVRLRLRIGYMTNTGQLVQDQVDFSGFPAGLTNGSLQ